jgi:glucose/arabinose dehydrogenase
MGRAMMRRVRGGLALAMCIALLPAPASSSPSVVPEQIVACPVDQPICWPVAFDFTPDGTQLFYVERVTGEIRRYTVATGADELWHTIPGVTADALGQGLLGLKLHPDWPTSRWVYVFYTTSDPLRDRLVRLREDGLGGIESEQLLTLRGGPQHNGTDLEFGASGRLFVVTGDANEAERAQRIGSPNGKVLRLTESGGVPGSNPFGNRTYSYGHRNSFGLAFDPITGYLWETENGPFCEDELNRIRTGGNFGWGPKSKGCPGTSVAGPNPLQPERKWNRTIAPTGLAFCVGCGLGPSVEGDVLVGSFNDDRIRALELSDNRKHIVGDSTLYTHSGPVLGMGTGPDGTIYFSDRGGINKLVVS